MSYNLRRIKHGKLRGVAVDKIVDVNDDADIQALKAELEALKVRIAAAGSPTPIREDG